MKPSILLAAFCTALLTLADFPASLAAAQAEAPETTAAGRAASSQTARIAQAAQAFLDTLNETQRAKVTFDFGDKAQRARWSNLPLSMAERRGLRLADLTSTQRAAVMAVLSATLSKVGYEKILGIMDGDEVLKRDSKGRGPPFGRDEYVVSFLGKPSATAPWMLQFGGHHLALNVTIVGEEGVMTPSLIAVQPARFAMNGKTIRPLGRETDKAFELVNALDAAQRKQAVLGFQMHDLVLGPGHDGQTIQPEGLRGSAMTAGQQQMLLDLIGEWAGIIHDTAANKKMAEIKDNLAETWFAWSGPTEPGSAAYFRVQGPTVVIEFAPQGMGGDATQHIHTMYRDFTNDYGKKLLAQ
jgi:hypothetical protein